MRVIVSVQAKRSSSRGLVHYIAHSKTDPQKEPKTREVFNEYSDQSTVEKSNQFLKNGTSNKRVSNEELQHLVISIKNEDYDRLGSDEKEKQSSLKQITRHAMKNFEEAIDADKLSWVAGIHRNTNNPHVHIAINKEYFDKNLERKTLKKIPKSLLPHYEKDGEKKIFNKGILITETTKKLDEILLEKEKTRNKQEQNQSTDKTQKGIQNQSNRDKQSENTANAEIEKERMILARAILAKFYLEKSKSNLESLENHGDKRRFKIDDRITSKKRKMSLFDLERRAEKQATRQIKELNLTDPIRKDELKKDLVKTEMQKNADGIKRIKTILRELVVKENQTLRRRENKYNKINPLAVSLRKKYRKGDLKLPIPKLNSEDLEMLQTASLDKKDIRTANYFERVRNELSQERGVPTRTNQEISRLKAKQTISKLKVSSIEKQSKDFQHRKRNFSFEIEGKKWSLSKVDSFAQKQLDDDQKITRKIGKVLGKIGLVSKKEDQTNLAEIKNIIFEKLDEKNEQIKIDLKAENLLSKTLKNFYKADTNPEKEKIQAEFNAWELADIEGFVFELKDFAIYQENWTQQKQFIKRATDKDKKQSESLNEIKENTIAGRAIAKNVMSEIELARSKEELEQFDKYKRFQKFDITNEKTGESKFVSLKEVELDYRGSLLDQTIMYFIENREVRRTRHKIEKIIEEKQTELKCNLKSAKMIYKTSAAEASDYKTSSFVGKPEFTHAPLFTPKELITVELRINQTENKSEAERLQKILDSADHSKAENLPSILAGLSAQKEFSGAERNAVDQDKQNSQITGTSNEILIETNKIQLGAKIPQQKQNLITSAEEHTKER